MLKKGWRSRGKTDGSNESRNHKEIPGLFMAIYGYLFGNTTHRPHLCLKNYHTWTTMSEHYGCIPH